MWTAATIAMVALVAAAAIAILRERDVADPRHADRPDVVSGNDVADGPVADLYTLPAAHGDSRPLQAARPAAPAPAGQKVPVAGLGWPEPAGDSPRAGTERAYYEEFLRLAGQPGEVLEQRARAILTADGPEAGKVAMLRALWDTGSQNAGAWFAHALRTPPLSDKPPSGHLSVAEFALGFLDARATREPVAMQLLADLVRDPQGHIVLRRVAAATVAAAGTVQQLRQLAADIAAEPDSALLAGVLAAAALNENGDEAARLFALPPASGEDRDDGAADSR